MMASITMAAVPGLRISSKRLVSRHVLLSGASRHCLYPFGTATRGESSSVLSDRCNLNIVSSPYPPIPRGPFSPVTEFVSGDWEPCDGGYLKDQVAIVDGSTGLTRSFADYYSTMSGVAAALRYDMGVTEDSTVALFAPNHVDYLPTSLAVGLCGAKLAPVNPLYTASELGNILKHSKSSVLIVHHTRIDVGLEAMKLCGDNDRIKHVVVMTDHDFESVPEGSTSLASLKSHDRQFHETIHAVHEQTKSHPFLLPYSSGTTGLPKGVCLTHHNIVSNLLQMEEVEGMAFPSGHKLISPLPFFHIYGFLASMLYCAWKGQKVITMSGRFDLEQFCQLVDEHRPQRAHLVPPIILGLAKHPIVEKYDFGPLRMIVSAAAPLGSDSEQAAKDRLDCDVKQAWGMSELSPLGTMNSDFNVKSGSVGPLVPSTYGKVVDSKGNSLPANESGELLVKGPQVMLGYLDAPEKTSECLSSSGWLRTGDIAHYDEDGFFFITDRLKELIKVRGYQVAPAELEELLLTHESVSDAAVIQVPDEEAGELPRAYVVRKTDELSSELSSDDIYRWVKDRVAPYKRLDGGVVFTNVIPKSASGKILRRILRDEYASEH